MMPQYGALRRKLGQGQEMPPEDPMSMMPMPGYEGMEQGMDAPMEEVGMPGMDMGMPPGAGMPISHKLRRGQTTPYDPAVGGEQQRGTPYGPAHQQQDKYIQGQSTQALQQRRMALVQKQREVQTMMKAGTNSQSIEKARALDMQMGQLIQGLDQQIAELQQGMGMGQ